MLVAIARPVAQPPLHVVCTAPCSAWLTYAPPPPVLYREVPTYYCRVAPHRYRVYDYSSRRMDARPRSASSAGHRGPTAVRVAGGYKIVNGAAADEDLFYGRSLQHGVWPVNESHAKSWSAGKPSLVGLSSSRSWPGTEFMRR